MTVETDIEMREFVQAMEQSELDELMLRCMTSTRATAELLFPHRFSARFSTLHDKIFESIDGRYRKTVIAAPRGLGKTSIVALALLAKAILFDEARYIVYICNNERNAVAQMENLKRALLRNEYVKRYWPDIRFDPVTGAEAEFSKTTWIAFGRTMVLPRGAGQEVRGLLHNDSRPDLIIIDDLESRKNIKNPDIRTELKKWFYADVMKCVSRVDKNWRIIYIDTMKHMDSLLALLLRLKGWKKVILAICDEKRRSLAPDFMSTEEVEQEYQEHVEAGLLDVFYREFMCIPMAPEAALFRKEYFRYYLESDFITRPRDEHGQAIHDARRVINIVIMDPAFTDKEENCETAIVCVGLDLITNKVYFRDCESGHFNDTDTIDRLLSMAERYKAVCLGVEVNSLKMYIVNPLRQVMQSRGIFYEIVELSPVGDKWSRICGMLPFYRRGRIYHNPECSAKLEAQLQSGDQSLLKDVMDCFSYFIQMMDKGQRYFTYAPGLEGKEIGELEFETTEEDFEEYSTEVYTGVCP